MPAVQIEPVFETNERRLARLGRSGLRRRESGERSRPACDASSRLDPRPQEREDRAERRAERGRPGSRARRSVGLARRVDGSSGCVTWVSGFHRATMLRADACLPDARGPGGRDLAGMGRGRADGRTAGVRGDLHVRPLLQRAAARRDRGSSDAWTILAGARGRDVDDPARHARLPGHVPPARRAGRRPPSRSTGSAGGASRSGWAPGGGRRSTARMGSRSPPVAERFDRLEEQLEIVHRSADRGTSSRSTAGTIGSRVRRSPRRACNGRTRRSSSVATADRGSPGWSRDGPTSSTR